MLNIVENWWKQFIKTREKIGWLCRDINVPIEDYRTRARSLIIWKKDLDKAICERKNWRRFLPNEVVKQKNYTWTAIIEWSNIEIDYTIWDISKNWIQIKHNWNELKVWDTIELTFFMWKRFCLKWIVKWNKNNLFWIEFITPEKDDTFSSLSRNYKNFVSMLISNTTH